MRRTTKIFFLTFLLHERVSRGCVLLKLVRKEMDAEKVIPRTGRKTKTSMRVITANNTPLPLEKSFRQRSSASDAKIVGFLATESSLGNSARRFLMTFINWIPQPSDSTSSPNEVALRKVRKAVTPNTRDYKLRYPIQPEFL